MNQGGRLKGVVEAFGTHARGRNAPEFRIENLNEAARRPLVSIAETGHQVSYGIGL
jgi:hypothetical protein